MALGQVCAAPRKNMTYREGEQSAGLFCLIRPSAQLHLLDLCPYFPFIFTMYTYN